MRKVNFSFDDTPTFPGDAAHFAIAEIAVTSGDVIDYLLGRAPMRPELDMNFDGSVDSADLVSTLPGT